VDKWKQTNEQRLLYSYKMDDGPWTAFQPDRIARVQRPGGRAAYTFQARGDGYQPERRILSPPFWSSKSCFPGIGKPFLTVAAIGILSILALIGYAIQRHFTLGAIGKNPYSGFIACF
jgi:hypothetical protein